MTQGQHPVDLCLQFSSLAFNFILTMRYPYKSLALHLSLTLILLLSCSNEPARDQVIHEVESPYHHIQVVKHAEGSLIDLKFGRLIQSSMKNDDPAFLVYPYSKSAFLGLTMASEPKRALFIGMGGGLMINVLRQHYPDLDIDVVDIDPAVVEVAKEYFHFREDERMKVFVEDGRIFLRKTEQRYDLIFLDTFNAEGVPFHLTTLEFLTLVKSRLTNTGCFISHFWGDTANRLFSANIRTHQEVFANVYMLNAERSGDFILLAPAGQKTFSKPAIVTSAQQLMREKPFHFDLGLIATTEFAGSATKNVDEIILTDDYAPVNIMRHQKSEK